MDRQVESGLREGPAEPGDAPPNGAPANGAPTNGVAAPAREPAPRGWRAVLHRRGPRRLLMWGVPLLIVLAGSYVYLTGGRYISTDDAYVKAGMVTISA